MSRPENKRIGIISIKPDLPNKNEFTFDRFYEFFGKNTGNYMFTTAMYRQLAGNLSQVGFEFNPDFVNQNFDAIVIPAANWLNVKSEWDWFCDLIDRVEIPVVTIGLGVQANSTSPDALSINESSCRLARTLGKKGRFISVRGNFTARFLHSIGVRNVVVTGCPSLYLAIESAKIKNKREGLVIQSTRYYVTDAFVSLPSVNRDLFRLAVMSKADIVYQSEPEEIEYILRMSPAKLLNSRWGEQLGKLYGVASLEELVCYIEEHGYVFFDIYDWSRYLQTKEFVIGTRLHGTILALNSGTPAALFSHDSRTAEMIEFARIPTASFPLGLDHINRSEIWRMANQDACELYYETRRINSRLYREFLTANDLSYHEASLV